MTNEQAVEQPQDDQQPQQPQQPQLSQLAEEPMRVLRVGTMTQQLLDEIRSMTLDDEGRRRLRDVQRGAVTELKQALSAELSQELERMWEPFAEDRDPSEAELRVAQAELVGWLGGVFQGIQTALAAQQMGAQGQLQQLRQGLPQGGSQDSQPTQQPRSGQYL